MDYLTLRANFTFFRHDRKEGRGGDVCVLTRRELNAFNIPVSDSYSDIELLCGHCVYV